ncbi:hypothetical protein NECAME_14131 [Necator americanus]|uniref:Uncharacterized protein n=1 Tax=Necator americanus TaxID=51031 RepID=W2SPY6_NECAM|nr:hypothetical protein NECAME_14131 [Necator americanus]ETN71705.1 hypothetical protein NECAME_14131 [Necator americanus]
MGYDSPSRGGSTFSGGRGAFTPRGNRGSPGFKGSGRGARGSFSEKRKPFDHKENQEGGKFSQHKKVFSAPNTPTDSKKKHKKLDESEEDEEDEQQVLKEKKNSTENLPQRYPLVTFQFYSQYYINSFLS